MAAKKTSKRKSAPAKPARKGAAGKKPKAQAARTGKKPAKTSLAKKAAPAKKKATAKPKPAKASLAKKAATAEKAPAKTAPVITTKASARKGSAPVAKKGAPLKRRDGSGHLDPKYAADLLRRVRENSKDDDRAFFKRARSKDDLAEELGEEAVANMTSGGYTGSEMRDAVVPEEEGGPFVPSTRKKEFARGVDRSNPRGAKREPFPTT